MFEISRNDEMPLIRMQNHDYPVYCQLVEEESDGKPWYYDLKKFIQSGECPPNASENDNRTLRRLSMGFFLNEEVFYKKNHDLVLLRCVDAAKAQGIVTEIHEGSFG